MKLVVESSESAQASSPQPRPGVMDIPLYVAGEDSVTGFARVIKLASNESPLDISSNALDAYAATASRLHRYPDATATALRRAIAQKFALESEQVVCACGSEEILHLVARVFAGPGDAVIASQYGFVVHRIAPLACGAKLVLVPERDYRVDLDAMASAVTRQTKMVYLANPGNPTGTVVSGAAVREFHSRLPPSVLLVIDAAYAEFAEGVHAYESGLALVKLGASNVLVTRTFSKMHGLAGLRIGWGYASREIIGLLNRVRPAFNANCVAQSAAIAVLEDDSFVRRSRSVNDEGLRQLSQGLAALGITTTESVCNFVLARFPGGAEQAAAAFGALKRRGIIVRPVGGYGLPDCLRISVGLAEDNAALLEGLRAFMESQ